EQAGSLRIESPGVDVDSTVLDAEDLDAVVLHRVDDVGGLRVRIQLEPDVVRRQADLVVDVAKVRDKDVSLVRVKRRKLLDRVRDVEVDRRRIEDKRDDISDVKLVLVQEPLLHEDGRLVDGERVHE